MALSSELHELLARRRRPLARELRLKARAGRKRRYFCRRGSRRRKALSRSPAGHLARLKRLGKMASKAEAKARSGASAATAAGQGLIAKISLTEAPLARCLW
jgi:hypothetical protein